MKTATFDQVAGARETSGIVSTLRRTTAALSTWNKRRNALNELYALSDRQLADIGLMRADIPEVVDNLMK